MSTNAGHLASHVKARRLELELNQLEVWQAGGPSNTTLTEIENGRLANLTRTTARKLDIGLRWEPGSARRVWEGGEPTPTGQASPADELRGRILAASFLTDEQKAEVIAAITPRQEVGGHDRPAAM